MNHLTAVEIILVILQPERETTWPNPVLSIVFSKFIFVSIFEITQPTALPIIYPMSRIIAAEITLGMADTTCPKNWFNEVNAGLRTAVLFNCMVANATARLFRSITSTSVNGQHR